MFLQVSVCSRGKGGTQVWFLSMEVRRRGTPGQVLLQVREGEEESPAQVPVWGTPSPPQGKTWSDWTWVGQG